MFSTLEEILEISQTQLFFEELEFPAEKGVPRHRAIKSEQGYTYLVEASTFFALIKAERLVLDDLPF